MIRPAGISLARVRRGSVLFGLAGALAVVAACTKKEDRILFEGHYYKAKASAVDRKQGLADFVVTVPDVSVSLDGARAAGAYEATRYCIKNFGSSRIEWAIGPETEPQDLPIDKDKLTYRGTCIRP